MTVKTNSSKISRRKLIGTGIGTGAAAAFGISWYRSDRFTKLRAGDDIISLGVIPPGQMPFKGQEGSGSALTVVKTSTGETSTFVLPVRGAHALADYPNGYAVVGNFDQMAFVGADFQVRKLVTAEAGWEFGGHGQWLQKQQKLLVGLRPARENSQREQGKLVLIDPVSGMVENAGSSGGYDPHDLCRLSSGQLAVCNYGHKNVNDLRTYQNLQPNIVIVDPTSFGIVETIEGPSIGSLSHFSEGPDGVIAAIPARLHNLSQDSLDQVTRASGNNEVELTAAEIAEGKVGFPSPVLTYHRGDKVWRSFLQDPKKQRRPQSIVFHQKSSSWFVTYPFSEQIVRVSVTGKMDFVSSFDLGVSYPRGLCVGARGEIYISGQFRGLVSIDPYSLRQTGRWDVAFHDGTHIYPARS